MTTETNEQTRAQAAQLKRQRFTVLHLCYGELCRKTGETASAVLMTLAHTRSIRGWKDRSNFDVALVEFMSSTKPGGSFMVGDLACIVRER